MMQILHNIKIRHLVAFFLSIAISLVIWYGGPLLVIANQYPLESPTKRCYLIVILFLVWILYICTKPDQDKLAIPKNDEVQNKLKTLQGRFEGAIRFLKKTFINKQGASFNLSNLPWYLLIGPSNAGKTTLLANANISYILAKQFKQENITISDTCDWWATRDLVLVDMPGSYLREKNNYLWTTFLNLIKKYRSTKLLRAVIVALPLPELIKQDNLQQKKQLIAELKQRISQLHNQFGKELYVYFTITKCDQLPGFLEFFNEYVAEELSQAWGITIPTRKINEHLPDIFLHRFNALIKRLNKQLILRLHQERNPNSRPAIKDFPLQMERLKEALHYFLKGLSIPHLNLRGVYLTSSLQKHRDQQIAQSHIINAHQPLQLLRMPSLPSKTYFVRQFISQGLLSSGDPLPKEEKKISNWRLRLTYVISIGAVITSAILLGRDFQHSVLQTYAIQNNLAQYQLAIQHPSHNGDQLLKALPLLNSLHTAANPPTTKLSFFTNFLAFYSTKSQKTATDVYRQALQSIVFPAIKFNFENYLRHAGDKDPAQIYSVLKAYLMLNNQKEFNANFIAANLEQLIPGFNKQDNTDLVSHISAASKDTPVSININNELTAQVRKQLTSLPQVELALVILKNINNNNLLIPVELATEVNNQPIFILAKNSNLLANLFTANKFTTTYLQETAIAAAETLQGNEILGYSENKPTEVAIQTLTQNLRSSYVESYTSSWTYFLKSIHLATPKNLIQTDTIISHLTSSSSPLLQLLQVIKQNTFYQEILESNSTFSTLNNLLTHAQSDKENTLYQIFVAMRQLHFHLQSITTSPNVGQAAFEAAKKHSDTANMDPISQVQQIAKQAPEPLKNWLETLAKNSWQFILNEAGLYIENAWQTHIRSVYQSQFANRYPLDPNADKEIEISQFASFIGKQGTFSSFYSQYLKPFVNEDSKEWRWRTIDGLKIPFSEKKLANIQDTLKLQHTSKYALFTQGQDNIALLKFYLPEKLT